VWVEPPNPQLDEDKDVWTLGLPSYHIDKLLDIDSLKLSSTKDSLLISWSGLSMSDGDETYHTIWDNVSGEKHISQPSFLKGEIIQLNKELVCAKTRVILLYEDKWICKIRRKVANSDFSSLIDLAKKTCMDRDSYERSVSGYSKVSPCSL